jgi:hypothetical protein
MSRDPTSRPRDLVGRVQLGVQLIAWQRSDHSGEDLANLYQRSVPAFAAPAIMAGCAGGAIRHRAACGVGGDGRGLGQALQPRWDELPRVHRGSVLAVLRPFFGVAVWRWRTGGRPGALTTARRQRTTERDEERRGPVGTGHGVVVCPPTDPATPPRAARLARQGRRRADRARGGGGRDRAC